MGRGHTQTSPSALARIEPAVSFHILRHTYASVLAMRGVPLGVIAAQLGHADTRMTERHYAHLAPNYVADTVRAALQSNQTSLLKMQDATGPDNNRGARIKTITHQK